MEGNGFEPHAFGEERGAAASHSVAQLITGCGSRGPSGNDGGMAIHKPGDGPTWCFAGVQCDDAATFQDTPEGDRVAILAVSCNLMDRD